jgi:hypothetical protein
MSHDALLDVNAYELKKSLIVAYRKAKADVFYQSGSRLKLLEYEKALHTNLETLLNAILNGRQDELFRLEEFTGTANFAPKSVKPSSSNEVSLSNPSDGNIVFTSPIEKWNQEVATSQAGTKPFTATFRLMSDCGIGLHVLSALWIMVVGDEIEKSLFQESPYANRIRRTRDKIYNRSSIGTFERYLDGYQSWISEATDAMDKLVKENKKVASFSTDAKEYFHSIPASILDSRAFEKYLQFSENASLKTLLTGCLSEALKNWEINTVNKLDLSSEFESTPELGLPVGLSCSALIGNAILNDFDKAVVQQVKPAFYGRYVDDITIVMEWHEEFTSPNDAWKWLSNRVPGLSITASLAEDKPNKVSYQVFPPIADSREDIFKSEKLLIEFKPDKTRLLVADKSSGKRMIDALKDTLQKNSSEWRMLARTPLDAEDIGPALITALDESGEPAVRSSQLKTLTSTRSTLSLWLREFEQLERLCDPETWQGHRTEFYKVIEEQLLNPLSIMDFSTFVHRALCLALNCGDLEDFKRLVETLFKAVRLLEKKSDPKISPDRLETAKNHYGIWRRSLRKSIRELVYATSPSSISNSQKIVLLQKINAAVSGSESISGAPSKLKPSEVGNFFYQLFDHDLALIPFKEALSPPEVSTIDFDKWEFDIDSAGIPIAFGTESTTKSSALTDVFPILENALERPFWEQILSESRLFQELPRESARQRGLFKGVVFPTRPLSVTQAISWSGYLIPRVSSGAEVIPPALVEFAELEAWIVFLRGFSIESAISAVYSESKEFQTPSFDKMPPEASQIFGIDPDTNTVRIPRTNSFITEDPKIAITSIFTDPKQITRSIAGKTTLDYKSYRKLTKLIDDIVSSPEEVKPDYILFPELAMPAPWFEWFGNHLAVKSGIGLISGITYLNSQSPNIVHNQVWASLPTPIIGFDTAAIYRQDKQRPAHGEEQNLRNFSPAKVLQPKIKWNTPPVIWHGDLSFALLICSELTNIAHRTNLRGKVDVLFVAEKNRDLNTFEALVDSAALDIHAFIAQSNSREFGDSRIRAPRKESHEREVARVRGGINDLFVVGKINVKKLREFQSWHYKGTDFKPLPDGFRETFDFKREWIPPAGNH